MSKLDFYKRTKCSTTNKGAYIQIPNLPLICQYALAMVPNTLHVLDSLFYNFTIFSLLLKLLIYILLSNSYSLHDKDLPQT